MGSLVDFLLTLIFAYVTLIVGIPSEPYPNFCAATLVDFLPGVSDATFSCCLHLASLVGDLLFKEHDGSMLGRMTVKASGLRLLILVLYSPTAAIGFHYVTLCSLHSLCTSNTNYKPKSNSTPVLSPKEPAPHPSSPIHQELDSRRSSPRGEPMGAGTPIHVQPHFYVQQLTRRSPGGIKQTKLRSNNPESLSMTQMLNASGQRPDRGESSRTESQGVQRTSNRGVQSALRAQKTQQS
ncbi:hypothetical protein Fmac_020970 [Flemingia macrophylla]|uniref:Uncharacterized protein n=1 Tax=Flemingia macrophylla TaxID=520843 RepID=A0ABD1LW16_9FABA